MNVLYVITDRKERYHKCNRARFRQKQRVDAMSLS